MIPDGFGDAITGFENAYRQADPNTPGPNMAVFSTFFLGNINQENVFNDILERKNAFLGYKKKNPTSRKIYIFFKGVNPWFWSKNDHFSNFFLSNIRQKNVFYDIPELNNALLFYKNKKSKNLVFVQNSPNLQHFLREYRLKNVFYDILAKNKRLSRLLKQKVQKVEKLTFF